MKREPVPSVTVVIASRNRRDELSRAVESALTQTVRPRVLVFDDASDDGTFDSTRRRFPEVDLIRSSNNIGLIAARNRGVEACTSRYVAFLDDDAAFSEATCLERALSFFGEPRVGAVDIPIIEYYREGDIGVPLYPSLGRLSETLCVAPYFHGGASVVRRDLFVRLGGFQETFFRQGEETDFCLRLLGLGYFVGVGSTPPVFHYPSTRRNRFVIAQFEARNTFAIQWNLVPSSLLLLRLFIATAGQLVLGVRRRDLLFRLRGLALSVRAIWKKQIQRSPVDLWTFILHRRLVRARILPLASVSTTSFERNEPNA